MKPDKSNRQPQPRPSEKTLGILRQFARCCVVERRLPKPLRFISPN
ncbi:MAG: hypothetical protein HFJ94_05305 [Muribaculaceae bacterium]|nr:hypothetical protein [Muribaculaceae bacterium]